MKRTALARKLTLALLFSVLAGIQMVSLSDANPDWAYNGADWRYVTTITGTSSQTVDVLVPNLAHWLVDGYCLTEGDNSQIAINTNTGGTTHKITRSGTHSVGFSSFSSNRGPANVHFIITTTNVLNYTLIVKYDANAPTTRTKPSPSQAQSPSPSPLPQVKITEPFPTAYSMGFVAAIVMVLLGITVYILKRKD